jgi:hypothetical protein
MYKEILISIVIIVSIFAIDKVTQDYTEEKSNSLKESLSSIREEILSDATKEILLEKMQNIEENWDNMFQKMAYYIEHDELEKVQTRLTALRSYIEMEDKTMAVSMIDENNFIIEHIKDKNSFSVQNIF